MAKNAGRRYTLNGPILVVLAAGMGSRYGGLKQMDSVGHNGEVLLDYSVYDAKRAGFAKTVFIIRKDIEKDFIELVLNRIAPHFPCELVYQELDRFIPRNILEESRRLGRTKPWGTTHAVLCAGEKINAPCAVINADDFYGREAFEVLGKFLSQKNLDEGGIVPYRLNKTLSPQGTVTRGVCVIRDSYLDSVDELTAIAAEGNGKIYNTYPQGEKRELPPDTHVSMNFWGFPERIFPDLQKYFQAFLETPGIIPKSECYLPLAADWFIKNGLLRIKALEADSPWFGVTYREDREMAAKRVEELVAQGVYPPALWK